MSREPADEPSAEPGSGHGARVTRSLAHPRGLSVLFFAEMWERFSFYGMRSLLTLYMRKVLGYPDSAATHVFHAYGVLVYAFPIAGGMLADRLLGYRLAVVIGALLMAIGHFVMAIPHELALYGALALLCLGNGFFKPNISSLVGQLYPPGDPRRDAGFTIFYMGINVGGLFAPLVCGTLGEKVSWHLGFSLAGVGMVLGLVWFLLGRSRLEGAGFPPDPSRLHERYLGLSRLRGLLLLVVLALVPVALALWRNRYLGYLLYPVGALVYGGLIVEAVRRPRPYRQRLLVALVLMAGSLVFWALFEQMGSSLTLFTDRNVDRVVISETVVERLPALPGLRPVVAFFAGPIPASTFLAFNSLVIIVLALPFAALWTALKRRARDPSIPSKFALGLLQLGAGFLVLVYLGVAQASPQGLVRVDWLLWMYVLITTGELCLSPVGLSAMTKLAPRDLTGTVMGAWFLASAYSHQLGGFIAARAAVEAPAAGADVDPLVSLPRYAEVFEQIGWLAVALSVAFFVASPLLRRGTRGIE